MVRWIMRVMGQNQKRDPLYRLCCVCAVQLPYLRRFRYLQTLNLYGNPISELDDYECYVTAVLKDLVYFDHFLVDPATVSHRDYIYGVVILHRALRLREFNRFTQ